MIRRLTRSRLGTVPSGGISRPLADDGDDSQAVQQQQLLHHGMRALVKPSEGSLLASARIRRGDILSQYAFERKMVNVTVAGSLLTAVDRYSGRRFAVKKLPKTGVSRDRLKMLRNETQLYLRLDHPNIARMIEIWESPEDVHIVLEHCHGGDLYQLLCAVKTIHEGQAARFVLQMLRAVAYLHSQKIVHRDLKLDNWMLQSTSPNASLKLTDFSFGRVWQMRHKRMRATCGALLYVSPENLIGSYTDATDMWSIGVTVYMLLCGYPPFFGTEEDLFARILGAQYSLQGPRWDAVSPAAKDFVCRLLQKDVELRMTAVEALAHPWIARLLPSILPALPLSFLDSMRLFATRSRFQRTCLLVIAFMLTTAQYEDLGEVFCNLCTGGEGRLTMGELIAAVTTDSVALDDRNVELILKRLRDKSDHRIGFNSFLAAALLGRLTVPQDVLRGCFRKFDEERTGFISFENVRSLLQNISLPTLSQMFAEADADGNGMIDFDEFCVLVTNTAPPALLEGKLPETATLFAGEAASPPDESVTRINTIDSINSAAAQFTTRASLPGIDAR